MELCEYWMKHPPIHVLVHGIVNGLSGAQSSEQAVVPTREDLQSVVDQFSRKG